MVITMKPNILVFVTDQQRADWLSCMGNSQLHTPNIDAIAARGTVFKRAYCNNPVCMPSRATLWTGLTPRGHGVRCNGIDLADDIPTLPQILRGNGYKTISVGKIHLKCWQVGEDKLPGVRPDPARFPEGEQIWREHRATRLPDGYMGLERTHFIGFHGADVYGEYLDELAARHPAACAAFTGRHSLKPSLRPMDNVYSSILPELYYNNWIADKSIEELDACGDGRPFFMWCSFPDPHFPFCPPQPYASMFDPRDMPPPIDGNADHAAQNELCRPEYYRANGRTPFDGGPTSLTPEQLAETKALAWGMVKSIDDSVGRVMAHLEKRGRLEDTIVVFLSDHGELMGDHGLYCKGPYHYEGLIRVPLIIAAPGMPRAQESDALVSLLDFMPTMLSLAGIEYPQGDVPDWRGPFAGQDIYQDVPRLPGCDLTPVLTGEKRAVQDSVLVEDDEDIRQVMVRTLVTERYKLNVYAGKGYGELFDLARDPMETENLWDAPAAAAKKAELMEQLAAKIILTETRTKRRVTAS